MLNSSRLNSSIERLEADIMEGGWRRGGSNAEQKTDSFEPPVERITRSAAGAADKVLQAVAALVLKASVRKSWVEILKRR